jgi:hypothetical protein
LQPVQGRSKERVHKDAADKLLAKENSADERELVALHEDNGMNRNI